MFSKNLKPFSSLRLEDSKVLRELSYSLEKSETRVTGYYLESKHGMDYIVLLLGLRESWNSAIIDIGNIKYVCFIPSDNALIVQLFY